MKYLSAMLMVLYGGYGIASDCGYNQVPAVNIEVISPHNRINNEAIFEVNIINVTNKNSTNAFKRITIIKDGVQVQQIIVNERVVAVIPLINKHGYVHKHNVQNFNVYGQNVLGFTDFDYKVNNQFYDLQGNLVRQFIVNNYVVAQEIVPIAIVKEFNHAFVNKNFVVLKQIRGSHCQFQTY